MKIIHNNQWFDPIKPGKCDRVGKNFVFFKNASLMEHVD